MSLSSETPGAEQEPLVIPRLIPDPERDRIEASDRPDRVIRNNKIYNEVVRQNNVVCSLLAYIRWQVLMLGREQYAREVGIERNTVRQSETATENAAVKQRYEVLHRLISYWRNRDEVSSVLIQQTIDEVLGEDRSTVYGLFLESEYRLGHGEVQNQTGITLPSVRAYRDTPQAVYPFEKLKTVLEAFEDPSHGLDIGRMRRVWTEEARNIFTRVRKVPAPLAELHVQNDMRGEGTLTAPPRQRTMLRTPVHKIADFEMPPYEDIVDIAEMLINREDLPAFIQSWNDALEQEEAVPRFHSLLRSHQERCGFSDSKIKRILGVTGVRPSALMRDPVTEGKADANIDAPPAVLAAVVSAAPEEAQKLTDLFRSNRTLWRTRKGSHDPGNPVRLDREQWGVTKAVLLDVLNAKKDEGALNDLTDGWNDPATGALDRCRTHSAAWTTRDLIDAENSQGIFAKSEEQAPLVADIRTVIRAIGTRKAANAVRRREECLHPVRVSDAVLHAALDASDGRSGDEHVEYRQLTELVRNSAPNGADGGLNLVPYISRHQLRRYAEGVEIPSYPVLAHILTASGLDMEDKNQDVLFLEWAHQYAMQLRGRIVIPDHIRDAYPRNNPVPSSLLAPRKNRPLPAALLHCIARVSPAMTPFAQTRMTQGNAANTMTWCINTFNKADIDPSEYEKLSSLVPSILLAADIGTDSPAWQFIELLINHVQDDAAALRAWRKKLGVEGDPVSLPGMTWEDIRIDRTDIR